MQKGYYKTNLSDDKQWEMVNSFGLLWLIKYINTLKKIVTNNNIELIIGSGNSGVFMTEIASLVYSSLNIKLPNIYLFPIYRKIDDFKNLKIDYTNYLNSVAYTTNLNLENILFLDDEICNGNTLESTLGILKSLDISFDKFLIVSDDQGFADNKLLLNKNLVFYPYASGNNSGLGELTNIIAYSTPYFFIETVRKALDIELEAHKCINLLFNKGIKDLNKNQAFYNKKYNTTLENKLHLKYQEIQDEYKDFVKFVIYNS